MPGKRGVKLWPLRLMTLKRRPASTTTISRQPSYFSSCSHSSPCGGASQETQTARRISVRSAQGAAFVCQRLVRLNHTALRGHVERIGSGQGVRWKLATDQESLRRQSQLV